MKFTAVTLFEGHYHWGAASLLNSLHHGGFTGTFVCAHRGARPSWSSAAAQLAPNIEVRWLELQTEVHLTNYKPDVLQSVLATLAPATEQIYYFDPDIVLKAPWEVLARWAADGLALVEDVNHIFPARHPRRLAWRDWLSSENLSPVRELDRYYNAGFFALPRPQADFLATWREVIARVGRTIGGLQSIKHSGAHALFHTPDQDALNLALMLTSTPLNTTGPEGMDFTPGGFLLSHAAGGRKPWTGGFWRDALRGRPPGPAQKSFFQFVDAPIPVLTASRRRALRTELRIAAALGRFYRRS